MNWLQIKHLPLKCWDKYIYPITSGNFLCIRASKNPRLSVTKEVKDSQNEKNFEILKKKTKSKKMPEEKKVSHGRELVGLIL